MSHAAAVSLLVKPAGPAGELLVQGLRAAGLRVAVVPTVFDAVAEAQRAGSALAYLIVGVDYFGPGEFRLFPLVRREWPGATLVACHSPGFEYKGRVAELVGADVVVCGMEEISRFIESLAPAQPAAAPPTPTTVQPPHEAAEIEAPAPPLAPVEDARVQTDEGPLAAAPPSLYLLGAKGRSAPAPEASRPPATPARPPQPVAALPAEPFDAEDAVQGEVIGTIELTEEELRLLLGEDEKA
ncbi:MAG: hypothetical protein NTX87_04670 [Planctomycetota bacterium]|nr:hypothetical protein [Planctomycetota bacterium]